MPFPLRLRPVATAATAGVLLAGGLTGATFAATTAQASTQRSPLAGTRPAWATGHAASVTTGTVNARIYLAGRDSAGLTAFATEVSSPGSGLYRRYLTPAQVQARYGPARSQIAAVESWATSAGLKVTGVDGQIAGYVDTTGSVAAAGHAFGVSFGRFRGPDGQFYRAPEQTATVPASVAADVLTVDGLDTAPHVMKAMLPPPQYNYWIGHPCSTYWGQRVATHKPEAYGIHQPWTNCGYTPAQIRGAYGVTASHMTGKGQTVAVVDAYASPTMLKDANDFAKVTGDQPFRPGQYTQHLITPFNVAEGKECGGPGGWYGEESLDVEAVHGEAPDANVRFVGAASCDDEDLANALAYIVNNHVASIVSDSWGDLSDQATITNVYEVIFQAGAAEGIGFYFSSGDNGYESPGEDPSSNKLQVDYPTSSPWVTSVGGTSLAIGQHDNYEFETSWGTMLDPLAKGGKGWRYPLPGKYPLGYDGSSGGGVSVQYQQPFYQKDVVPASMSHRLPNGTQSKTAMRVVPDVSTLADPSTGMLVGETTRQPNGKTYAFSLSRIGGTSVACPVFAGIEADAQQAAGYTLGFANPVIYARYGTAAFHDVTDTPLGPGVKIAEVRSNYADASVKRGPMLYFLRTLGIDGEGAATLNAIKGYDEATGVGSPARYIQSFEPK
jgi:subtilase family serine protease